MPGDRGPHASRGISRRSMYLSTTCVLPEPLKTVKWGNHEDSRAPCWGTPFSGGADRRSCASRCDVSDFQRSAHDGDGRRITLSAEELRDNAGLYDGFAGRGCAVCYPDAGCVGSAPSRNVIRCICHDRHRGIRADPWRRAATTSQNLIVRGASRPQTAWSTPSGDMSVACAALTDA